MPAQPRARRSGSSETAFAKDPEMRYPGIGVVFLVCTAIGIVTSARHLFLLPSGRGSVEFTLFLACIVYLYPWIALAPLVFRMEGRFPLGSAGWPRSVGLLSAVSVPLCLLASVMMFGAFVVVLVALGEPVPKPPGPTTIVRFFFVAEAMFWSSVAGGYVVRTRFQLQEQERRTAKLALDKSQLEVSLNQAQLEALRARLNPHFLFNSLQNISAMTGQDPQTASRMLARLGDLLRVALRQDSQPETTLREEIELTRAYVALEQMRFGDRLDVHFGIAPTAQEALVPCFLLQPLIENAVTHGLRGARRHGVISVSADGQDGELVLTVVDNGVGLPAEDAPELRIGLGLGSTSERLARMYPNLHTFFIRRREEGGTEVRIAIPLRFAVGEDHEHHDE